MLLLLGILIWSSVRERSWLVTHLKEEVGAGVISPQDYVVITSYWKRVGQRLRTLMSGQVKRWWKLGRYYRLTSELAFDKNRWSSGIKDQETARRIEQLRRDVYELRKSLGEPRSRGAREQGSRGAGEQGKP